MALKQYPFFSIVIPTFERPTDLRKCLESLDPHVQSSKTTYEIIVTDDSNSNKSKRMVYNDFPRVIWSPGKHNGPAGNRNAGVDRINGDWIIFIDDDCIADTGYINAYYNAILQNREIVLYEGKIYPDRPRRTWAECCPENSNGGMFWTSNLCVKKSIFREIGGFDEKFKVAYEDIDFAHRITSKGFKSKFVKDASVCHPWRTLKYEGNNWKPRGFEISELILFIKKHPDAKEHNSLLVYLRNLLRMITTDLLKCIIQFKGNGIKTLISQIITTVLVIKEITFIKYRF